VTEPSACHVNQLEALSDIIDDRKLVFILSSDNQVIRNWWVPKII
jgi:hypothetical protein